MKRHHFSYDNLKNWKEEESEDSYAIVPAPNAPFFQLVIPIPVAGVFYWLLHYEFDIQDKLGLLMADCIVVGTSILMIVFFLYNRHRTMKDLRPHLLHSASSGSISFPRHARAYQSGDLHRFFIAHDFFNEGGACGHSEFNLIELIDEEEICYPLLHHLGRYRAFDRIGKKLKDRGVPFVFREVNPKNVTTNS